jgi:hypothetical protein
VGFKNVEVAEIAVALNGHISNNRGLLAETTLAAWVVSVVPERHRHPLNQFGLILSRGLAVGPPVLRLDAKGLDPVYDAFFAVNA